VLQLVKKLGDSAHAVLPFVYEQLAPVCDSTPKVAITLDLVLFWYRDLLSLQLNRSEALIYDDQTEVLKSQMLRYSPDQLVQAMSFILEARKQLDAHVNGLSVLERLTVKLGGIH
jgi:DNA polymerase-3 subunit delta'